MIGLSPSIWFDRQGQCPNCGLLVALGQEQCPHCGHEFSEAECKLMTSTVNRRYTVGALLGLLVFSSLIAGLVILL